MADGTRVLLNLIITKTWNIQLELLLLFWHLKMIFLAPFHRIHDARGRGTRKIA